MWSCYIYSEWVLRRTFCSLPFHLGYLPGDAWFPPLYPSFLFFFFFFFPSFPSSFATQQVYHHNTYFSMPASYMNPLIKAPSPLTLSYNITTSQLDIWVLPPNGFNSSPFRRGWVWWEVEGFSMYTGHERKPYIKWGVAGLTKKGFKRVQTIPLSRLPCSSTPSLSFLGSYNPSSLHSELYSTPQVLAHLHYCPWDFPPLPGINIPSLTPDGNPTSIQGAHCLLQATFPNSLQKVHISVPEPQ